MDTKEMLDVMLQREELKPISKTTFLKSKIMEITENANCNGRRLNASATRIAEEKHSGTPERAKERPLVDPTGIKYRSRSG
ncbi:hypothetical protein NDU88_001059 [Pleurodeles waltl]|uniref:Uncharacterized protein n=1 Tax=Pleurodeles waltl TaxID=8319 RepID=A0AAV7TGT1_PLEWA|nr:hypothetical protein NDU88_001059 [Pleurodeles waltl]